MIDKEERQKLWELYPEVQELFEQYNGICFGRRERAWKEVVENCHLIHKTIQQRLWKCYLRMRHFS